MIPDDVETFGAAVRWARERKGLSLRALGELLGVSAPFLSDIEHNRRWPADIAGLAGALGVPVSDLEDRCGRVDRKTLEFIRAHPEVLRNLRQRRQRCDCVNCMVLR